MKMLTIEAAGGNIAVRLPVGAMVIAFVLLLANLAVATLSVTSGSFDLSLGDVWNTLTGTPPTDMAVTIVWEFRIPRLLVAILVGMLLALSGAVLQYVTANPLADPSLVGVSQGAALAVVMAIVVFLGTTGFALPALAYVGGLAAAALIQILTYSRRGDEPLRFILTGIGVAALIGAVISTVLTYGDIDRVMSALTWLAGSLHSVSSSELQWLFVTALVIVTLLIFAVRALSALRFGPELATGLGLQVRLVRALLILLSVGLAAGAVAAVGPLGFVGLVAPHIARRRTRAGVGLQLVLTALTGGLMVSAADLLGRAAFGDVQLPAGIVTAAIGVPVLIIVLFKGHSK